MSRDHVTVIGAKEVTVKPTEEVDKAVAKDLKKADPADAKKVLASKKEVVKNTPVESTPTVEQSGRPEAAEVKPIDPKKPEDDQGATVTAKPGKAE